MHHRSPIQAIRPVQLRSSGPGAGIGADPGGVKPTHHRQGAGNPDITDFPRRSGGCPVPLRARGIPPGVVDSSVFHILVAPHGAGAARSRPPPIFLSTTMELMKPVLIG